MAVKPVIDHGQQLARPSLVDPLTREKFMLRLNSVRCAFAVVPLLRWTLPAPADAAPLKMMDIQGTDVASGEAFHYRYDTSTQTVTVVPEPSSIALATLALGLLDGSCASSATDAFDDAGAILRTNHCRGILYIT